MSAKQGILNISWALVFCIDTHMLTLLKHNCITLKTNMTAKCELFMDCNKAFKDICKKKKKQM